MSDCLATTCARCCGARVGGRAAAGPAPSSTEGSGRFAWAAEQEAPLVAQPVKHLIPAERGSRRRGITRELNRRRRDRGNRAVGDSIRFLFVEAAGRADPRRRGESKEVKGDSC
jgi:hypothetical protein